MTRQNAIHRHVVKCEKHRKSILKIVQQNNEGRKVTRSYKNRKWFRQLDKDFDARWRKEQKGETE